MLVAIAILLLVSFTLIKVFARRNKLRKGVLEDGKLERYRALLVESVGERSRTQHAAVPLRKTWTDLARKQGEELTGAQRYVILDDLLRRNVLLPAYSTDSVTAFFQGLSWNLLQRPVTRVVLSDLDWQRLASGQKASIVANGGDIIYVNESPGAGVVSRSPHAKQSIEMRLDLDNIERLIHGIESDAASLQPGTPLRLRAERFVIHLRQDSERGDWERVRSTLTELLAFAANAAGLWVSTMAILQGS